MPSSELPRGSGRVRRHKLARPILAGLPAVLAVAALALLAPAPAASAATVGGRGRAAPSPAWNYGVDAAEQVNTLPVLEPTAMAGGTSSFDRDTFDQTHGNYDFGHFLSTSKKFGNVMLDQKGPGCVYRIWMTSLQSFFPNEWIKIYFDGAAKPAINMTIGQIFAGTNAPFLAPLVQGPAGSSGGYTSYVPLCYHRSIEIVTNMDRYYDIGYVSYAPNANVTTWTPSQDTSALRQLWDNASIQDPIAPGTGSQSTTGTVGLPAHKAAPILNVNGPASIQSIKLTIPGVTATESPAAAAVLNQTWIQIFWDGEKTPSVSAPLGSFFGMGQFGSYPTHALVVGLDSANELYMYLPMPFQHSALVQLWNRGATAVNGVGYNVQYQPFTGSFSQIGYFKTSFTTTTNARVGHDIPILSAKGSGKFIGVTASYTGDPGRLYLEGDERIYVDGSGSPAFYGTGTEDFFNGAFYFIDGPYSNPMSGNTAHLASKTVDETAAYRFFLPDAIPFRRSIVVGIQHGPYDNTNRTSASMLAYYYQKPASQEVLTDTFDVGKVPSDQSHHYAISAQNFSGRNVYTYEGVAQGRKLADDGRGDRGSSKFTMRIAANNQGVDLRRRLDQGIGNQSANVFVDGRLVGTWLLAGSNPYHRWADSDFIIPAGYTRNRTSINLKIQYVSGNPYWSEYTYWAYSLVP
jgi:Protein of unknown function (DUF2961)